MRILVTAEVGITGVSATLSGTSSKSSRRSSAHCPRAPLRWRTVAMYGHRDFLWQFSTCGGRVSIDDLFLNLTTIRAANPDLLGEALLEFGELHTAIADYIRQLNERVRVPLTDGSWNGEANEAAITRLDAILQRWQHAADRIYDVESAMRSSRTVTGFVDTLENAQAALEEYDRQAAQYGLAIDADGSVHQAGPTEADGFEALVLKEELEDRLGQMRRTVTRVDAACATVLTPPSDDDGFKWQDWLGRLGNFSSVTSILGTSYRFSGTITVVTGIDGIIDGVQGFFDAEGGLAKSAQAGKAAFNLACIATVADPLLFPLVPATAAWWGGSNLLDRHWSTITDAWGAFEETSGVRTALDTADDVWDAGWERGGDLLNSALDTGGDMAGGLVDAAGPVSDAASGAWHSIFG